MPQRSNRLPVSVVALLFALSLVAAFGAGFARGEGTGGSLPVAAANVHATPGSGGGHGQVRLQDRPSASTTSAPVAVAGELDRPEIPVHVDLSAYVATDGRLPSLCSAEPRVEPGVDPPAGHGPRPPPARGPPDRAGT